MARKPTLLSVLFTGTAAGTLSAVALRRNRDAVQAGRRSRRSTGLRGNVVPVVAAVVLALIAVVAILAPLISPYAPTVVSTATLAPPSAAHWFGTDEFGRDVLSRVLWGAHLTLVAAAVGVGIGITIGVPLGLIAGYSSRAISATIMRGMDVLLAFPGLLLALVIVTVIGSGIFNVTIAVGISFVPVFTRVTYGSTLSARGRDYVLAARVLGYTQARIMRRHILPNIAPEIVIVGTSALGWAILLASTLSFLGFGVHLPTPEWGADLAAGQEWLGNAWWISTFPGLAITLTILATNFLGDGLTHKLDPHRGGGLRR